MATIKWTPIQISLIRMQEPHEVLGVAPDATEEETRRAYRVLAQIYHPDRFATATNDVLFEANRRMQEVSQAYSEMQGGRLVYWETPRWSNDQRAAVTVRLLGARIPHRWDEEGELSVDRQYEDAVDKIIARP